MKIILVLMATLTLLAAGCASPDSSSNTGQSLVPAPVPPVGGGTKDVGQ